jgi:hypothetical protein
MTDTYPIFSDDLTRKQLSNVKCFTNNDADTNNLVSKSSSTGIPLCNNTVTDDTNFFAQVDSSGCCITDDLIDKCPDGHNIGLHYLQDGDISRNVCHKQEIRTLFSLHDHGPSLQKFFTFAFISVLSLALAALTGSCYQFWLIYGKSMDCLYYQSNCDNISSEGDKASVIDYVFPSNILKHPYQPCQPCNSVDDKFMFGGNNGKTSKFVSNYSYHYINGTKCIVLDNKNKDCKRTFPYNIPDLVNSKNGGFFTGLIKVFGLSIIIPLLFYRKIFNGALSMVSKNYSKNLKDIKIINTLVFIILSGLIGLLLYILKVQNPFVLFFSGPFSVASILTVLFSGPWVSIILFILLIISFFSPTLLLMGKPPRNEEELNKAFFSKQGKLDFLKYYKYPIADLFYWKDNYPNISTAKQWALNILMCLIPLPLFIIGTIVSISIGMAFVNVFWVFQLFFGLFYYPLSNGIELFDIMKKHSDFLTVFFCVLVFASASSAFEKPDGTNHIRGIMGAVLAVIILIKIFSMSSS